MDLISIVVPVYNTEKYLKKCLNSLINQTYKNIEIIVVNDGSKDNSLKVAEEIAKSDDRIKIFSQKNQGLSSARNKGIFESSGKYIGFIDSDDYVEESMFEDLYNMAVSNDADMSICGWYVVKKGVPRKCDFNIEQNVFDNFEATNILLNHVSFDNFACNKLFKKKLFDDILFPTGKLLEDLLTIYKLINKSKKIVVNSKPLYYYVLHDNSITSNLYNNLNEDAFNAFIIRKNDLLTMYPKLYKKIMSNYFTASKSYFYISLKSKNRNKDFEKERIKDMRKNIFYVWSDTSIPIRVKVSSTLITIFPYLYFKVRK